MSARGYHLAAIVGNAVYVRVVGLGNMNNSVALKLFLERAREDFGLADAVFDLSECEGFDSTFMGVLLGTSLGGGRVLIANPSDPHRQLLAEVGLDRVVHLLGDPVVFPDVETERFDDAAIGVRERARYVINAHENLARWSRENAQRFGPFLEMLRAELREG